MKKLLGAAASGITYLSLALPALAQNDDVLDASVIEGTDQIISPDTPIGAIVSFVVAFIIVIAFLAALFYIVIGAFQWITSGGDKEKVASARNHIVAAVIGLVVIALSFVIINVVIQALGLGDLANLQIPTLECFTNPNPDCN